MDQEMSLGTQEAKAYFIPTTHFEDEDLEPRKFYDLIQNFHLVKWYRQIQKGKFFISMCTFCHCLILALDHPKVFWRASEKHHRMYIKQRSLGRFEEKLLILALDPRVNSSLTNLSTLWIGSSSKYSQTQPLKPNKLKGVCPVSDEAMLCHEVLYPPNWHTHHRFNTWCQF